MIRTTIAVVLALCLAQAIPQRVHAQDDLQALLQDNAEMVADPSRRTVQEVLDILSESGLGSVPQFLTRWEAREVYQRDSDGMFVYVEDADADPLTLINISTGAALGTATSREVTQLRPNGGVRRVISGALVQFQVAADDPVQRGTALDAIENRPDASHLPLLRARQEAETDPQLQERLAIILPRLVISFAQDEAERIAAIRSLAGNVSLGARATLNPLLATELQVHAEVPEGANIAEILTPGSGDLSVDAAYQMLVDEGLAPALIPASDRLAILTANVVDGRVGGLPTATLDTDANRDQAYAALVAEGLAAPAPTAADISASLAAYQFIEIYREPNQNITDAANEALGETEFNVGVFRFLDLSLDGISLASIYFLAAIGLAITFGVMGVINMAHGEFIMMGAYTGYVVQTAVPNYTLSIAIAIPLAFAVTFAAGVLMERSVIRWLYHRPLETLLATFGISIALQQIVRQIFGTQARPLTPPDWLAGSVVVNDVLAISTIRIGIFLLGVVFFLLLWGILNRTRLGLEVRAVTQNPRMAASMGINPDRINMLTFGLGSGIAGIAGVAIGLFSQVVPDMGSGYIVQSFMTVVVGGVGNVFGTLVGATMIGSLQKAIEWLNPSNTLAAQTYMILFVILFIQFRPRGIIALKGRAAGD